MNKYEQMLLSSCQEYRYILWLISFFIGFFPVTIAQHSVARKWNDILLESIRRDFARPTVHSRNLFHISAAMYDAWAAFDEKAEPYFLGKTVHGFYTSFEGVPEQSEVQQAREEAISYAAYRLITHRFQYSPGAEESLKECDSLLSYLGYDQNITTTDYSSGSAGALGNYIAEKVIQFGLQDDSNEQLDYGNLFYQPINGPLAPELPGNPSLNDPNRWQTLTFELFIDQSGNPIPGGSPPFLGPEWGFVMPFSLTDDDLTINERNGDTYWIYHDPGDPPYIDEQGGGSSAEYQWGFSLVALWSSHLDPKDSMMWDISPGSIGNVDFSSLPTTIEGLRDFYDDFGGGDPGIGHEINPYTGQPYEPQMVPRADYARVLAEFWADGPESETPPGHWFTILNYVNDHPLFEKRYKGQGEIIDDLEWDVKAYFMMGGAMHDAAVSSWGIKGYYDYLRPISAIRWMAGQGQSTNPSLTNYSPDGIPLVPGLIEIVLPGDSLAIDNEENIGKIKLFAWRGPGYISDPETDFAGVGWILAENWWPYQRPTFVTPPFAGYISGHSTFSRAAAEIMTSLTGDPFFPGGMGEFIAKKNEFLVFEEGPSVDVILQWATYRDASDQTSLSRIWGGIHPPADDIPGRIIGEKIAKQAFEFAETYFEGNPLNIPYTEQLIAYPNPIEKGKIVSFSLSKIAEDILIQIMDATGRILFEQTQDMAGKEVLFQQRFDWNSGMYTIRVIGNQWEEYTKVIVK